MKLAKTMDTDVQTGVFQMQATKSAPILISACISLAFAAASLAGAVSAAAKAPEACKGKSIVPALAQSHPKVHQELIKKSQATPHANAVFWRISKPGNTALKPSYVLGTVHTSDKRVTLSKASRQALLGASTVALEIKNFSPNRFAEVIKKDPRLILYLDGQRLDKKLGEADFSKLAGILRKHNVNAKVLGVFRPWFPLLLLAFPDCEQHKVRSGAQSFDKQIASLAKSNSIEIVGLETIGEQMNAFAAISDAHQISLLRLTLAYADQREDQFETIIDAYAKRKLGLVLHLGKAMAQIKGFEIASSDAFNVALIHKRNDRMFKRSLPLIQRGNAFIAVGAGHLIGKTGLVAQYKRAGYKLEPID